MTKEEYRDIKEAYRKNYERAISDLNKEYALANNPYAIGDKIRDHYQYIQIEKVNPYMPSFGELPCCTYHGPRLRKDGTPMKSGEYGVVYQNDIEDGTK